MAGSWYEIKNKKIALDKKRGATFTKLSQAITLAVKQGGADSSMNASLELVLKKAKSANMTNELIDRAIRKGKGESLGEGELVEIVYEGYAPFGVPMLIVALTDNTNRTVAHVRHVFSKYGGKYADIGSVGFQFKKMGIMQVRGAVAQDDMELALMDCGVEDYVLLTEGLFQVTCQATDLSKISKAITAANLQVEEAKIGFIPLNPTIIDKQEEMEALAAFFEYMEDHDDIQEIYSTMSMNS